MARLKHGFESRWGHHAQFLPNSHNFHGFTRGSKVSAALAGQDRNRPKSSQTDTRVAPEWHRKLSRAWPVEVPRRGTGNLAIQERWQLQSGVAVLVAWARVRGRTMVLIDEAGKRAVCENDSSLLDLARELFDLRFLASYCAANRLSGRRNGRRQGYDLQLTQYDDRGAGDPLHNRDGALTHERHRHRVGAHAVARGPAGDPGGA